MAAWDFRISDILTGFPLLLLWFVERPAGEACEHRRQIAAKLLDMPECCFKAIPTSDIQWKLRIIFPSELQAVRDTGKVPSNLLTCMLVWRSHVPADTQVIERFNVVLQGMIRRWPGIGVALVFSCLQIKKGDPICAEECCEFQQAALSEIRRPEHGLRFDQLVLANAPLPATAKFCVQCASGPMKAAVGYRGPAARDLPIGAKYVISFVKFNKRNNGPHDAFIISWSWHSTRIVVEGRVTYVDNVGMFTLQVPATKNTLLGEIADRLEALGHFGENVRRSPMKFFFPMPNPVELMFAHWPFATGW